MNKYGQSMAAEGGFYPGGEPNRDNIGPGSSAFEKTVDTADREATKQQLLKFVEETRAKIADGKKTGVMVDNPTLKSYREAIGLLKDQFDIEVGEV